VATGLVVDAAFDCLATVEHVEIRMDRANDASAAVPRKLGFLLDRAEDRPIQTPGHTGHGLVWAMTRDRWRRGATAPH
jgi:RimJ/RimL family protein N-acetyltransferase